MLGAAASGQRPRLLWTPVSSPKLRLCEFTYARCVGRLRLAVLGAAASGWPAVIGAAASGWAAVIGAAASRPKLRLRGFTFARSAVGRVPERLREFLLASLCYGRLQWLQVVRN